LTAEWSEATLAVVANWYAKNLPRERAIARYEEHFHRNRRRLMHRRDGAPVATEFYRCRACDSGYAFSPKTATWKPWMADDDA